MSWTERARQLRPYIVKAAESLSDEDAFYAPELFDDWKVGVRYLRGIRVRYEDKLYRCEQEHTSQEDWTPDITPAMWTEVPEPGQIPVWKQPTGAQDAYRIGDRVYYPTKADHIYECTSDYNIYAPDVFGWVLIE